MPCEDCDRWRNSSILSTFFSSIFFFLHASTYTILHFNMEYGEMQTGDIVVLNTEYWIYRTNLEGFKFLFDFVFVFCFETKQAFERLQSKRLNWTFPNLHLKWREVAAGLARFHSLFGCGDGQSIGNNSKASLNHTLGCSEVIFKYKFALR